MFKGLVVLVHLISFQSPGGVSDAELLDMFLAAQYIYARDLGVELRLHEFSSYIDPTLPLATLEDAQQRFGVISQIAPKGPKKVFRMVATAPIYQDGGSYCTGLARICGYLTKSDNVAWFTAKTVNSSGDDRFAHSVIALVHELGHLLGLPHLGESPEVPNIMHPNALKFGDELGLDLTIPTYPGYGIIKKCRKNKARKHCLKFKKKNRKKYKRCVKKWGRTPAAPSA